MPKRFPIGIFDSGVGGLTVFKTLSQRFPYEDIIYLGDTAHLPYGDKSPLVVRHLSLQNTLFLLDKNAKLIIVACNTSSSLALEYLKKYFKVPILGVIDSQVKSALKATRNKRIGVIGTLSTIKSGAYESKLRSLDRSLRIFSRACPLFVPLVEEALLKGPIARYAIKMYLEDFKKYKIDTLILACTHYPLLKREIDSFFGGKVKIIDASISICEDVKRTLYQRKIPTIKRKGVYKFFVTDDIMGFSNKSRIILGRRLKDIRLIRVNV